MAKIDPKKEYNVGQIAELELFGVRSHKTVLHRILRDRIFGSNILKAVVEGNQYGTRYKIKGSNIIKYMKN